MTERRVAFWFALFAVVVFVAGLGSGLLLDRIAGRPRFLPAWGGMRGGPNPARLADRLTRELSLTADQAQQVRDIFERRRGEVREMHRELRSQARRRFEEEQAALRSEIRTVLTPDQQAKFDALVRGGPDRVWPGPGRFLGPPPPPDSPER
jgi:Spy/CpxP family protein refolding chaperone